MEEARTITELTLVRKILIISSSDALNYFFEVGSSSVDTISEVPSIVIHQVDKESRSFYADDKETDCITIRKNKPLQDALIVGTVCCVLVLSVRSAQISYKVDVLKLSSRFYSQAQLLSLSPRSVKI